ncbi:MAG: hypothetical protein J6M47_02900 [Clostridia bacterium]|nr:hypothetical protein [Clostridia bacterium]
MNAAEQGGVFLIMMLAGAGSFAACGAAAMLLRTLHAGPVLCGLADLTYGVVFAAGIVAVSLALRVQAVRWYVFAGAAAGAALTYGVCAVLHAAVGRLRAFWRAGVAKRKINNKKCF